jgi:hypothetical protein
VPVDYVSAAIVTLSRRRELTGRVYHLANPQPLAFRQVIDWMASRGYALRRLPFAEWQAELLSLAERFPASVSSPYLPLIEEISQEQVFMPRFDSANTLADLADTGITCPPLDAALLDTYLDHWTGTGLVPRAVTV